LHHRLTARSLNVGSGPDSLSDLLRACGGDVCACLLSKLLSDGWVHA
jgi:hypothetical protein